MVCSKREKAEAILQEDLELFRDIMNYFDPNKGIINRRKAIKRVLCAAENTPNCPYAPVYRKYKSTRIDK